MKKATITLIVLGLVGGSVYAYYRYSRSAPAPTVTTAPVTRGDIVETVGATGSLQAVTTVQVGTQVSGTIQELRADFNSLVRKGQVLARLDPSLFQTQVEQARANLIRAQADLERLRVALDDARTKLGRAKELSERQLIPRTELDNAEVTVRSTEAQIRSAQAQVNQAEASLNQTQVNLQHTVIAAPIDGLVISRNVDVGQTVAASMQAPTLFVLAADLTKMQVVANLDESDVGRIRPGQRVIFRVDAYPTDDFTGTVAQVRLQPIVQQNVVTYATVIDVPNPELKLKPGMTANVNIEIARRADVPRVPNAALRFRPTNEIYAALKQTPVETAQAGPIAPPSKEHESAPAQPAPTASDPASPATKNRAPPPTEPAGPPESPQGRALGGFGLGAAASDDAGRRQMTMERLQSLPPEQRQRMLERLRARGLDPTTGGDEYQPPQPPRRDLSNPQAASPTGRSPRPATATTIDALFGPLPHTETFGRVWLYVNNQLKPVRARLGISDGQATELIEGGLEVGTELVTSVVLGTETTRPTPQGAFPPFLVPRGRIPGGPPGRGGRGG